ncbi:hypothetical protein PTTG_00343 [Puccinia triticina 1-1 BBBD Race 1]|uniref:Uncharacterized protein n=2 Tax=Puccinia triticina TaxID=208348 RepID=A0A180H126_PUCT1|nr:uncharacterized protein PtA15_8A424 [Puccinia triticina]OAV98298.1 hypothetical protein PTTG_00343 [Puccinia triticina 1-1 BBBD Race 1]WAQ87520.1 hypothetical protein PtA15_8A424 [Puccinia triticina]WAR57376.1 hypothetical protein PtB15_8B423 [Puccinia triticina]
MLISATSQCRLARASLPSHSSEHATHNQGPMTLASLGRRTFSIGRRISGRSISTSEALIPSSQPAVIVSTSRNERTGKKETRKTTGRRPSLANVKEAEQPVLRSPTKPARSYPIRKQFIFESYLDLFTTNQVCLLFRHEGLTCREWNSIRGKVKNLSSSSSTIDPTPIPFGEFKFEPSVDDPLRSKSAPRIQVLRTKMILPVLKSLLKQSKIRRQTYDSLIYSAGSPKPPTSNPASKSLSAAEDKKKQMKEKKNLTGSLFSISQADFDPSQIKQVLQIIAAHGPDPSQQQEAPKKPAGTHDPNLSKEKIKFLIGFIDRSICKDTSDLQRFSNLNSLDNSRSQIIGIISRFSSDLLFNLNQARASQLVHTLKGFQKTLEDQAQQDAPAPDQSSPDQPTPTE